MTFVSMKSVWLTAGVVFVVCCKWRSKQCAVPGELIVHIRIKNFYRMMQRSSLANFVNSSCVGSLTHSYNTLSQHGNQAYSSEFRTVSQLTPEKDSKALLNAEIGDSSVRPLLQNAKWHLLWCFSSLGEIQTSQSNVSFCCCFMKLSADSYLVNSHNVEGLIVHVPFDLCLHPNVYNHSWALSKDTFLCCHAFWLTIQYLLPKTPCSNILIPTIHAGLILSSRFLQDRCNKRTEDFDIYVYIAETDASCTCLPSVCVFGKPFVPYRADKRCKHLFNSVTQTRKSQTDCYDLWIRHAISSEFLQIRDMSTSWVYLGKVNRISWLFCCCNEMPIEAMMLWQSYFWKRMYLCLSFWLSSTFNYIKFKLPFNCCKYCLTIT